MEISIELSLYPLAEEKYKDEIWSFISRLKANTGIRVETNGMSTQVFGPYDETLQFVMNEMKLVHQACHSAVFILKIIAADRQRQYA
ncbi:hypothetical protein ACFSJY_10615 [Thalassotalea euphylliae]|uniref:hypothetical protein n=1 Tax=Thalassotalea euphylliae TaxID=1655234 RepID=UPI00362ACF9B